jgi:hypothetical protein
LEWGNGGNGGGDSGYENWSAQINKASSHAGLAINCLAEASNVRTEDQARRHFAQSYFNAYNCCKHERRIVVLCYCASVRRRETI